MFSKIVALSAILACIYAVPIEHASSYSSVQHHDSHHAAPVAVHAYAAAPVAVHSVHAHHEEVYPDAHPKYEYKYGVEDHHTGDNKSQQEVRDGDVVKGEYTLVQPDGVVRKVAYSADHHNGFNAEVSYTGHAAHPEEVQKHYVAAPEYHH